MKVDIRHPITYKNRRMILQESDNSLYTWPKASNNLSLFTPTTGMMADGAGS